MGGGGRTLPLPRRQSLVTAAWDDMARRAQGFRSSIVRRISVVRWDPPRYAAASWHAGNVGWTLNLIVVTMWMPPLAGAGLARAMMVLMLAHRAPRVAMTLVMTVAMTVVMMVAMTVAHRVHPVAMAMMVAMTVAVVMAMTVAMGHVPRGPSSRLRHADRSSSPSADSPCSRPRERGPQSPSRVRRHLCAN
jgi:hypothetical protein